MGKKILENEGSGVSSAQDKGLEKKFPIERWMRHRKAE
jgi:hypothetical protein